MVEEHLSIGEEVGRREVRRRKEVGTLRALERRRERDRVGEVGHGDLASLPLPGLDLLRIADDDADLVAAREKGFRRGGARVTRNSGDDVHGV
jgi:hypothetical protein